MNSLDKIIDIIDTKLMEAKSLFPVELGSGTDDKFSNSCRNFRNGLFLARVSLNEINGHLNKKSKKSKKSTKKVN